jgi:hypothetical protein
MVATSWVRNVGKGEARNQPEESEVMELDDEKQRSSADSKLKGLSKEEPVELVKLSSRMILAVDGLWYLSVKELAGNDKAQERDNWIWDKVMKFYVNDLAGLLSPSGLCPILGYTIWDFGGYP